MEDITKRRNDRWNFLFVAGMWFQDLFNYDFRRTEQCIIPYATQEGEISFCAYNTGVGWRNIIEKMHMTATLTKWYEEHGRHEIIAGGKAVNLKNKDHSLVLRAEDVHHGKQHDLDDLGIAKTAREEKKRGSRRETEAAGERAHGEAVPRADTEGKAGAGRPGADDHARPAQAGAGRGQSRSGGIVRGLNQNNRSEEKSRPSSWGGFLLVYTSRMGGNFAILNPCPKKWLDLEGDGRARFCNTCNTHVHAIADYSPDQWNRLWQESGGHVCGFLGGESTAPRRSRRAILVGALLTAVSPLFAASGRVRFRVIDLAGTPVPKASIAVLDSQDKTVQCVESDEAGEAILTGLPLGDSQFTVTSPGFVKRRLTLTFHNRKEVKVEVHLRVSIVGTVVEVKPRKRAGWLLY